MKFLTPEFEQTILESGKYRRVIGIDEVGRGCWAGPVYVGTYEFNLKCEILDGITDSKKISPKNRDKLYTSLIRHSYKLFIGGVDQISAQGIGFVLRGLILDAVTEFNDGKTLILVDGYFPFDYGDEVRIVKKGDATYYSIAAASIIAKVSRDNEMKKLALKYPGYGFEKHVGYGTKAHRKALSSLGVTEIHRTNYKPVMKLL